MVSPRDWWKTMQFGWKTIAILSENNAIRLENNAILSENNAIRLENNATLSENNAILS